MDEKVGPSSGKRYIMHNEKKNLSIDHLVYYLLGLIITRISNQNSNLLLICISFFQLDFNMVILMTLMLMFNADFDGLVNKKIVENVQLKYSMLLQRYLR